MNRGMVGSTFAALAVALVCGSPALLGEEPAKKAQPNVLFIAVDDLRPEFGAYGQSYVKTPNIDRLASRGVTFDRAYCQQAVCSPSRSSLLTGMRPDSTKVYDLVTHFRVALPEAVTLPQFFKENGYFVRGMGKLYHPGYDDPKSWSVPWETEQAVGYALEENRKARQESVAAAKAAGKTAKAANQAGRGPAYEGADVSDETFLDGKIALKAVKALQEQADRLKTDDARPFFLGVGFARPHLPFVSPKKYWDLYDASTITLAPNPFRQEGAPEYAVLDSGELRNYYGIPKKGPVPDDLARTLKHGYYASISYMDAQVGKVLDELDRLGLREKTIVVFWGDHGWKLGEHAAWCKHSNVELDTRVPLIVAAPGVAPAGAHSKGLVEFVDIYPTLADLAGLTPPKELEGASFAPLLRSPDRAWKSAAFSQYPRGPQKLMGYTLHTDRYRLTEWVAQANHAKVEAVELYDLQTDPQENHNIAADPAQAETLAKLTAQLRAGWRSAVPAVEVNR
ncbi:sulfatase [Paludisphaera rhizosphaerae]|uniref:sulfatase n=1 Tax=Paludisphaera rhizosphaerae TaxID=2711216 RepID=UPI0019813CDC|nr:sulfatase [Paludisphaera rhizosphaerae]